MSIRAFVNAQGVDVEPGATALDAVRAWKAEEADAVTAGSRLILDSRGLPVDPGAPTHGGAIYRTRPNRARAEQA